MSGNRNENVREGNNLCVMVR